jgi:hypothetical protein
MGLAPGAPSAFKGNRQTAKQQIIPAATGKAALPAGTAPTAGAGVPEKLGSKLAAPSLESMATSNPALGAMFGLLFGRVMNNVPGLKSMLSNPGLRDITLGAAVAGMVAKIRENGQQNGPQSDIYNPRPEDHEQLPNGWKLQ